MDAIDRRKLPTLFQFARVILGLVSLVATLPAVSLGSPAAELHKVSEIRALPAGLAGQAVPVNVEAVVTYYDPLGADLFIRDATGGIYVLVRAILPISAGSRVRVTGVTTADFTNSIDHTTVIELSHGARPIPLDLPLGRLISGREDCEFVTTSGKVRTAYVIAERAESHLLLRVEDEGKSIDVEVLNHARMDPVSLIGATVRVTGAVAGKFNERKQLISAVLRVQEAGDVVVTRPPAHGLYALPLQRIDQLLANGRGLDIGQRGLCRGVVTYVQKGRFIVLQEGPAPLVVGTGQETALAPGKVAEVSGFLAFGVYRAHFDDANYRRTGGNGEVAPMPVPGDKLTGAFDSRLVAIQADLVEMTRDASRYKLVFRSRGSLFSAFLETPAAVPQIDGLRPGSRLQITGVCFVEERGVFRGARGFRLMLRSPRDIEVIRQASWWNATRLLYGVGGLTLIVLATTCWIAVLRRRIAAQTMEIRCVMEQDALRVERAAALQACRARVLERINSREPIEAVLTSVAALIQQAEPQVTCYIHVLDDSGALELAAATCDLASLDHLRRVPVEVDGEVCARAAFLRHSVVVGGPPLSCAWPVLSSEGILLGSIAASLPDGDPGEPLAPLMEMGTNLAALAIDNRRFYDSLRHLAQHDILTGLPNRGVLYDRLRKAIKTARLPGDRVSVAYLDLDNFKQVNDRHGHQAGDAFLQSVAARLRSAVRANDILARIGGDEFIVISPGVHSRAEAHQIGERLLATLEGPLAAGDGLTLPCPASIGIAVFPDDGLTVEELERFADQAMYAAKAARKLASTGCRELVSK